MAELLTILEAFFTGKDGRVEYSEVLNCTNLHRTHSFTFFLNFRYVASFRNYGYSHTTCMMMHVQLIYSTVTRKRGKCECIAT